MRTAPGRKKITWWEWVGRKLHLRKIPLADRGEAAAARFLRKNGLKIIARNRRHHMGEIDLIAIHNDFLVFVEVRTRTSEKFMRPEDSIRSHKRRALLRTVRGLLRRRKLAGLRPRIDIVAILWPDGSRHPATIRWHKAAIPLSRW